MQVNAEPKRVLLVDRNRDLIRFLVRMLRERGFRVSVAQSCLSARRQMSIAACSLAVIERELTDGNGIELAVDLLTTRTGLRPVITTHGNLSALEDSLCRRHGLRILEKPFAASSLVEYLSEGCPRSGRPQRPGRRLHVGLARLLAAGARLARHGR